MPKARTIEVRANVKSRDAPNQRNGSAGTVTQASRTRVHCAF